MSEAAVVEPQDETATPVEESPPDKSGKAIWKFSEYIDIMPEGEGGKLASSDRVTCEAEAETPGSCEDPSHFHAWCRLPNKLQYKDLREKALAAKARKQRQLRDPSCDAHEVLEAQMDDLMRGDQDETKKTLIREIVEQDAWQDQVEAIKDVAEIEAEDQPEDTEETVYLYAHIEADQERLAEIRQLPDEERPTDEYEELLKHVTAYWEATDARIKELQRPRVEAHEAKDLAEIVDMIREQRINAEGTTEFLYVINQQSWLLGTMKSDKSGLKFGDVEHMKTAAPEEIEAMEQTFARLETALNEGKT